MMKCKKKSAFNYVLFPLEYCDGVFFLSASAIVYPEKICFMCFLLVN